VFTKSRIASLLAAVALGALAFGAPAQAGSGINVPVGDLPHQACGTTVPVVGDAVPLNNALPAKQCVASPGKFIGGVTGDLMKPQAVPQQ